MHHGEVDVLEPAVLQRLLIKECPRIGRGERHLERVRVHLLGELDRLLGVSFVSPGNPKMNVPWILTPSSRQSLARFATSDPHAFLDVVQDLLVAALIADQQEPQAIVAQDLERGARHIGLGVARPDDSELAELARETASASSHCLSIEVDTPVGGASISLLSGASAKCWLGQPCRVPEAREVNDKREDVPDGNEGVVADWANQIRASGGAHPIEAGAPEECIEFTSQVFRSPRFNDVYRAPSYRAWLDASGYDEGYQFLGRFLRHLQGPGATPRRWILKSPEHVFSFDALARVP